jgi:hypothetical protein
MDELLVFFFSKSITIPTSTATSIFSFSFFPALLVLLAVAFYKRK